MITRSVSSLLSGIFVLTLLLTGFANAQSSKRGDIRKRPLLELMDDFTSSDYLGRVARAKDELESRGKVILPDLIRLLDSTEKVELENTADLIYPGAKQFYGHGGIVDYDIDRISVRAGWLLEELTFQSFGFREGVINHDDLLTAVINGKRDRPLSDVIQTDKEPAKVREARIGLAVASARRWFSSSGANWSRLSAIVVALSGSDTDLQHRVFAWLRNGDTTCEGLDIKSFEKRILPLVRLHARSRDKAIREEAKLLIDSHSGGMWWYRNKLKRDHPDDWSSVELTK